MGSIGWQDLTRHVYCIARSGHGKSAILRNLVHQLMASQDRYPSSIIYIDPKGDDAIKMLLEAEDLSKVTSLDPVRAPFSINPLELPPRSKEDEERIRSMYTGFMMRLIQEWYSIDKVSEAPRMLRIIERVIDALYFLHGAPTFLDLHHVTTVFQKGDEGEVAYILSQFSDVMQNVEELKRALHSIAQMKGEAFDPVLTRLERFARDPYLKRLFCARHSTVDLSKSLEPGHLTIVRVPAHEVGSHIAPFVMGTIVIKLWFCVLERASRIEEEKHTPVILALDEFQELKGLGVLEQMLAQARAFKLGLWLSHQNLQQIDDKMLATVWVMPGHRSRAGQRQRCVETCTKLETRTIPAGHRGGAHNAAGLYVPCSRTTRTWRRADAAEESKDAASTEAEEDDGGLERISRGAEGKVRHS